MPNLDFSVVQNYMIIFCILANVHATTKNSFEPWKQYDNGNNEENNLVTMGKFKVINK